MILFRSSAGEGCIELHTNGDTCWFRERWLVDGPMIRGHTYNPYGIIKMVARNRWATWSSRPWLGPMLEFMVGHFGEDLFTLVALENM